MAPKRCRPRACNFAVHELQAKWQPFLDLRDAGFEWDGSQFCIKTLSNESLAVYSQPLEGFLQVASSGFPSHLDLRNILAHLQSKYGIFSQDKNVTMTACNDAADAWRAMAKQLYTLKKSEVDVPSLRHLIEIVQLPKHQADQQETESNSSKAASPANSPPSSM